MRVGIDLVKTSRFSRIAKKPDFLQKHFCESELKHFNKKQNVQTLAGIFCAKEAFLKAIGVGVLNGIKLTEINVCHCEDGRPRLNLTGEIKEKYKINTAEISITHDAGFAVAVCVIT